MATGTTGPAADVDTLPRKHEQTLPARPDQVRIARAFTASVLAGCLIAADVILCVSELVANSVLHSDSATAGGTFTVRAEVRDGDYAWIEVEDNGGHWDPHPRDDGRPHGLSIVSALASDWGIDGDYLGRVAWARFDVPAPDRQPRPVPS